MPVLLSTAYFPPVQYIFALLASCRQCNFALQPSAPGTACPGGIAYNAGPDSGAYNAGPDGGAYNAGPDSAAYNKGIVWLEARENYQKQSWRNRCDFYAASGRQSLSVPVVHEGGTFSHPVTEIRIDWSKPWLQQHCRAIVSAYRKAAFFDYYWDGISAVLQSRPETLWDLNLSILRFLLDALGVLVELRLTTEFTRSRSLCTPGCEPWQEGLPYNETLGACDLREVIHPKRPDCILSRAGMEKPYFQVFACKHGFIPNLSVIDLLLNEGPDSLSYLL